MMSAATIEQGVNVVGLSIFSASVVDDLTQVGKIIPGSSLDVVSQSITDSGFSATVSGTATTPSGTAPLSLNLSGSLSGVYGDPTLDLAMTAVGSLGPDAIEATGNLSFIFDSTLGDYFDDADYVDDLTIGDPRQAATRNKARPRRGGGWIGVLTGIALVVTDRIIEYVAGGPENQDSGTVTITTPDGKTITKPKGGTSPGKRVAAKRSIKIR
jgi:hypothetical protein